MEWNLIRLRGPAQEIANKTIVFKNSVMSHFLSVCKNGNCVLISSQISSKFTGVGSLLSPDAYLLLVVLVSVLSTFQQFRSK